jgi:hypothetical protein
MKFIIYAFQLIRNFLTRSSPNIISVITLRKMKQADNVARMGGMRNSYKMLVGKPAGKITWKT